MAQKWKPGTPLTLRTPRFVMRSLQPEDIDERLLGWMRDPDLMNALGGAWRKDSVETLRESIARLYDNKSDYMLGIFHEGELIGCYWIEGQLRQRSACTHHFLGNKDWWGKGVPMECRGHILDWLFAMGFERVEGRPYASSIRAIRGYMKQGWHLEGVARRASRDRAGERHDNMLFAMLPEDWVDWKRRHPELAPKPQPAPKEEPKG